MATKQVHVGISILLDNNSLGNDQVGDYCVISNSYTDSYTPSFCK